MRLRCIRILNVYFDSVGEVFREDDDVTVLIDGDDLADFLPASDRCLLLLLLSYPDIIIYNTLQNCEKSAWITEELK